MSMFIFKALRRAELFLEQVVESVAQGALSLTVEGATGAVDYNYIELLFDEDNLFTRASAIPSSENRTRSKQHAPQPNEHPLDPEALGDDVVIYHSFVMQPQSDPVVHPTPASLPAQTPQTPQTAQPASLLPAVVELPTQAQPKPQHGLVLSQITS